MGSEMCIRDSLSTAWYQKIGPCDLGLRWNWPLSGAFVFHKHILFSGFKSLDSNKIDLTIKLSLNLSRMVKDALYF